MTQHYQLHFDTPIYSSAFINPTTLILGAGGGTTKSGITNKLTIININTKQEHQLNLQKGDDVPMSMHYDPLNHQLICGINSTSTPEHNTHLRTFQLDKNQSQLKFKSAQPLLTYQSNDHYQRITCLSPQAPKLLAIGGTNNQLELLHYPTLKPAFKTLWCEQDQTLYTVDFHPDGSQFLVGSSHTIKLFSTKRKKGKLSHPHLIRQIERPTTEKNCTFRNAMYGRGMNSSMVYTILNHLPSRGSSVWGKKDGRKAQLISWQLGSGERERCKLISSKPVTCFDVSASGRLVAFSSSDLSIGILDGASLRSLLSILHAHEFPVTSLKFSPDDSRVVSCSADMTMRVIELDGSILDGNWKYYMFVLGCVLVVVIAVLLNFLFLFK